MWKPLQPTSRVLGDRSNRCAAGVQAEDSGGGAGGEGVGMGEELAGTTASALEFPRLGNNGSSTQETESERALV